MKLVRRLSCAPRRPPVAPRLLPLTAAEQVSPQARWEPEDARDWWSCLKEARHCDVVVGYHAFLAPDVGVLDPSDPSDDIMMVPVAIGHNRVAIWNARGTVLDAIDESTLFDRAALGSTIEALAERAHGR